MQTQTVRRHLRRKVAVQQKVPREKNGFTVVAIETFTEIRVQIEHGGEREEEVTSHPQKVLVTVLLFPFANGSCVVTATWA